MIGIIGLGFVGGAINKTLREKGVNVCIYDKFKPEYSDFDKFYAHFPDMIFVCVPTPYISSINSYDTEPLIENLDNLNKLNYTGVVIVKSTLIPGTVDKMVKQFSNLKVVYNPEFLSAKTAYEDFFYQTHIVVGVPPTDDYSHIFINFMKKHFPAAKISKCSYSEGESMKIMCNCFYAMKIQLLNEFYLFLKKKDIDYDNVMQLMLKNDWINPMHTKVPGTDGSLSYGGYCFPKDTKALLSGMIHEDTPHEMLKACVKERDEMREDHLNVQ